MTAEVRITPSGGFTLRAPALPFGVLVRLHDAGDDLLAALADVVADPAVREAIFLASPNLEAKIDAFVAGTDPEPEATARALLSYVTRMTARPMPFGLFAGVTTGRFGERTDFDLGDAPRVRRTRLDYGFLAAAASAATSAPGARAEVPLVPNTSLYLAGGRLRMAESTLSGGRMRYHRVTFEPDDALLAALDAARGGARRDEIAAVLVDDDVTLDDAREFVDELIDAQLLLPQLGPVITSDDPTEELVRRLADVPSAAWIAATLTQAQEVLAELDRRSTPVAPAEYRSLADDLRKVDAGLDEARLVQVDMVRPAANVSVGPVVVQELVDVIRVLHRITRIPAENDLLQFAEAFRARYEDREVPLVEALDEEIGIGFGTPPGVATEGAPLLRGLPGSATGGSVAWRAADARLIELMIRARTTGADELVLTADDIAALERPGQSPLPDAFAVAATLAAPSAEAVDAGDFTVYFNMATGPSGARLAARFCHADEATHEAVRVHVAEEEARTPERIFAEVVHLPEGRIGNILSRPVLRTYEIPFLGISGAPTEHQITPDDLMVSVAGDRIVLRSKRLDREVEPRITNAHSHGASALPLYRFLGALGFQGVAGGLLWHWGPFDQEPFLPRVRVGRTVVSRAQWRISAAELAPIVRAPDAAARAAAVEKLVADRRLPSWVVIVVGDKELPLDVRSRGGHLLLAHEARAQSRLHLVELIPAPDELCTTSAGGPLVNELIVPFVAGDVPTTAPQQPPLRRSDDRGIGIDTFPPGSEWLTAKLYCGQATADNVLREGVLPLVREAVGAGCDGWFFLRFSDPGWHLRLRLHGDPRVVGGALLPLLAEHTRPLLEDGRIASIDLTSYRRELDRYGGLEATKLAEKVFQVDSETVLSLLHGQGSDGEVDDRWRLALVGVDRLLADLGFDLERRHERICAWRDALVTEHGDQGVAARHWAGRLLREERRDLEQLLEGRPTRPANAVGLQVLAQRSERWAPLLAELHRMAAAGELAQYVEVVAQSYAHMHVNRMLRGAMRTQEMVIYELLDRLYRAQLGRARAAR